MMDGRQDIIGLLHKGNYSCVIAKGNDVRAFHQRGVRDLLEQLDCDPAFLRGASIADKVVGKAAAALIAAGGILSVYADTISLSALYLLEKSHIPTEFGNLVPYIRNRNGTDWCPMEKRCHDVVTISEIIDIIKYETNGMK